MAASMSLGLTTQMRQGDLSRRRGYRFETFDLTTRGMVPNSLGIWLCAAKLRNISTRAMRIHS